MQKGPLVSIPVITYNSSKYVIDTLESIKAQTYRNIELIISDDCSTDDTVTICRQWINNNKTRFVRSILLTSQVNTGVSANLNRAEAECKGVWVKGIAGDDILLKNSVEIYMNYVSSHPEAKYVFAKVKTFGSDEQSVRQVDSMFKYERFYLPPKEQMELLIHDSNYIPASTYFYNRQAAIDNRIRNDERIPLLEDHPKWINILRKKQCFSFINTETVMYRVSKSGLSTSVHSLAFRKSDALLFIYYQFYPQFFRNPSKVLLFKMMQAHEIIGKRNILWSTLSFVYREILGRKSTQTYF